MANKEQALFICPRRNEVATAPRGATGPAVSGRTPGPTKIIAAIKNGQSFARSALRNALLAVRQAFGGMSEVDAHIVDPRTVQPRR